MSLPEPTTDGVLAGMLAAIAAITAGAGGTTAQQYLRVAARYAYKTSFTVEDGAVRGAIAGRTPAVLVDYVGDRSIRTTIGRKVDKVESTYIAICVADPKRVDRQTDHGAVPGLFNVISDVRRLIGARAFGFNMQPMRFSGIVTVAETAELYAWGVKFTTRRHVDYTKDPGTDVMLTVNNLGLADGAIKDRYGNVLGGVTVRF